MLALSMISTDLGLMPLNGIKCGNITSLAKFKNLSPFIVPSVINTSCIPSMDTTGIAVYLIPLTNSL